MFNMMFAVCYVWEGILSTTTTTTAAMMGILSLTATPAHLASRWGGADFISRDVAGDEAGGVQQKQTKKSLDVVVIRNFYLQK